jgi:hypothetical protein
VLLTPPLPSALRRRPRSIARNRERLAALGLNLAAETFHTTLAATAATAGGPKKKAAKAPRAPRAPKGAAEEGAEPAAPSRRSGRLAKAPDGAPRRAALRSLLNRPTLPLSRNCLCTAAPPLTSHANRRRTPRPEAKPAGSAAALPPSVEPGSELALFIIDGECPRCGKAVRRGHREHLARCGGPPPEGEVAKIKKEKARTVAALRSCCVAAAHWPARSPPPLSWFSPRAQLLA